MISGHCESERDVRSGRITSSTSAVEWHQHCQLPGCECPEHYRPTAGQTDIFGGEVA